MRYIAGQDGTSTNGVESFRALLKRAYIATHHWWSVRHLHFYISEYAYRHNSVTVSGEFAIGCLLRNGEGVRLTYDALVER